MLKVEVGNSETAIDIKDCRLDYGDIHSGLIAVRSLWIHNPSEENLVSVTLTASRWPVGTARSEEEEEDCLEEVAFESISNGRVSSSSETTRTVDGEMDPAGSAAARSSVSYDSSGGIIKRSKCALFPPKKSSSMYNANGTPTSTFLAYIAAKNPRSAVRKLTATMADLKKRGHTLDTLIDLGDEGDAAMEGGQVASTHPDDDKDTNAVEPALDASAAGVDLTVPVDRASTRIEADERYDASDPR